MVRLITNTGVEVLCDSVTKAASYPVLYINTNMITPIQAYQIFGDEEAVKILRVIDADGQERIYHNYSDLYSVQKSIFYPKEGEIAIWLNYKMEDAEPTLVMEGS